MIFFLEHALWLVPLLFLGLLAFMEFGYRRGRKALKRQPEEDSGTGAIEAAIFALMGLLLAFTFNDAQNRWEHRRQLVIQEANAISTAYLRLDLLSPAAQPPLRKSFRDYLEARIAVYEAVPDLAKASRELEQAKQFQREIWSRAEEAVRAEPWTPAAVLLIPALNAMIDVSTERTIMANAHSPSIIFLLLLAMALFSAAVAGYGMSRSPSHNRFHWFSFALIISITIYVIADLEYPRRGLIRLDATDQVLIQLRPILQ